MINKHYNTCQFCDRRIWWRKYKDGYKCCRIDVEPVNYSFIPVGPSEIGECFIDTNGNKRKGRETTDGIAGYKIHQCK